MRVLLCVIRWRLDHISSEIDTYRDREVSLLTIRYLEWYICVDQRVLCVMYETMCYVIFVCCMMISTGPKGPTSYDWTRGSNKLRD